MVLSSTPIPSLIRMVRVPVLTALSVTGLHISSRSPPAVSASWLRSGSSGISTRRGSQNLLVKPALGSEIQHADLICHVSCMLCNISVFILKRVVGLVSTGYSWQGGLGDKVRRPGGAGVMVLFPDRPGLVKTRGSYWGIGR